MHQRITLQRSFSHTSIAPISHIIEDGVDGFLLRPADKESLANLLIEIFSGSIPTKELGERARAKVVELFDVKKMTDLAINAYGQILTSAGLKIPPLNASHQQKDLPF